MMYYNRTISQKLASLLEPAGELRWLFDFVKSHKALDFQIGKNKSEGWISVYRGLTRILRLTLTRDLKLKINAANKYKSSMPNIYGVKDIDHSFETDLRELVKRIEKDKAFDRYYNCRKEGYFQNEFSRHYGICGLPDTEFVIVDKEAVIGYEDQIEKNNLFGTIQQKYKQLQKDISLIDARLYGQNLEKKAIGNELDFLALDKEGNILLIEFKHGSSTSGIYLSPLQIGLYYDLFSKYPKDKLSSSVLEMLEQKQKIGLINPKWKVPDEIKEIIPVLVIAEPNPDSSAKKRFEEILNISKSNLGNDFLANLRTYDYALNNSLTVW